MTGLLFCTTLGTTAVIWRRGLSTAISTTDANTTLVLHAFESDDAVKYGVSAAIILGRCRYITSELVRENRSVHYGFTWIHRSLTAWEKEFPFYSRPTIRKALDKLVEADELIRATSELDLPGDYRSFYRTSVGGRISTHIHLSNLSNTDESILVKFPTPSQLREFFEENGYRAEIADKAYEYYSKRSWCDRYGNPVYNWRRTMQRIWFKPENKQHEDRLRKWGI